MAGLLRTFPSMSCCKCLLIYLLLLCISHLMQCKPDLLRVSTPMHETLIGLRLDLVHRDSMLSPNITSTERFKGLVQRSQERLERLQMSVLLKTDQLSKKVKEIQAPVTPGSGEFLMTMAIGKPSLSIPVMLDTGTDLIWTQCKPCNGCYNQSTPIYDPSLSSTYKTIKCNTYLCQAVEDFICVDTTCQYVYVYGDYSSTKGILAYETFTFSSGNAPHIAFGCGKTNIFDDTQASGIVGFGRGPLSLNSQLGSLVGNKFSYCLMSVTDSPSKTSPLFLGHTATMTATSFSSTPLIQNSAQPTFYYLSLEGISIGGQLLNITAGTFDLKSDGSGGVIIDSGTTLTYLEANGYIVLLPALDSSINLPRVDGTDIGLDLCYSQKSVSSNSNFPTITFHFKGADYHLPKENYMLAVDKDRTCLAMSANPGLSIFGNIHQQNYQILYDNGKNMLSFAPAVCDAL